MRLNRLALIVTALLPAVFATGQALPYANARTTINAGVLLIESQRLGLGVGAPANIAPHVWSNLDKDNGVKPASWSFDNPLGQSSMTADAFNRWNIIQGGPAGLPLVGTQLRKSDASYWEVSLTTSTAETLSKFDVLSLTLNGTLSLNSIEREKLRRFMDQGGILWVDLVNDASITTDLANGLPYGFDWAVTVQPVEANLNHPLMRSPNPIRLEELDQMKYSGTLGDIVTRPIDISALTVAPLLSWITPDSLRLEPIAGNSDGRSVSAAQLGEGYLVVTTAGVTSTINRGFNAFGAPPRLPQVNRGFRGLAPVQDQATIAAAKFAINVLSLATNYSTLGGNSRNSGGSAVTVDAPLFRRFRANFGAGAFEVNKSAAIYKGYIITTAANRISVFDADPSRDIDRDGDPDDGIPDPLGSGTDLIWQSEVYGTRLSSPTLIEVPSTTLGNPVTGLLAINQIWVLDSASQLRVFDLENPGGTGLLALTTIFPPLGETPATGDPSGPYAPTVHEGIVVVADSRAANNDGRVWLVDLNTASRLNTGIRDWSISNFSRMSPAGGSASVGYIPIQDGSSGLDRVIYVPHQPTSIGAPRPASLTSLWLGVRGEQPVRTVRTGAQVRVTTRASYQRLPVYFGGGASSLGIKITLLKPNGDPFTLSEMQTVFTGGLVDPGSKGDMIVQLTAAPGLWDFDGTMTPGDPTDDVGWRLDYTIDWGQVSLVGGVRPQQYVRGTLEFPDTVANSRRIVGGAALGPNGNILIATSEPGLLDVGSTLFNLKETGRGEFSLVYRYDLYDGLTFSLNQGAGLGDTVTIPPTFIDQDELLIDLSILDVPITALKFVGAPVVRGDTVYAVAAGRKLIGGLPIQTSVMMTFDADPAPLEFEVQGADTNFTLVQPDITRSTTKTAPTTFSTMRQGQFSAELIPNSSRVRVILTSAMSVRNNRISDTISSSLPVIIRRSGQTDTLVEPEAPAGTSWGFTGFARGRFDPLQWYAVLNGYRCITPPVVTGQTMFFAGASVLPDILNFGVDGVPAERGLIYAFDSKLSPNDEFLRSGAVRTWQQQLTTVKKPSGASEGFGDYIAADAWLWPQFRGAENFEDIRIRMMQATLPDQQAISLAVGGQALAVTGNTNLYGFTRSDFFVVDEGRVSRFDSSGNPIWSATQTLNAGRNRPVVNAGSGVRLSRPTRMYPDPSNSESFWIVDSGNDRVALVDASGRELRTIRDFKIDPAFVPAGMGDSEALTLRDPRDVYVFESRVPAANNGFSNARPLELWKHVVIAEAGHNRVIELIDRYELDVSGRVLGVVSYVDPNAGVQQALGILKWHTPEELTGKRFSYNSIANSFVDDGFGGKRKVVSFGFGNVEPGRATFGLDSAPQDLDVSSGYGGVVLYDGPNSIVITSFAVPEIPVGAFLAETAPGSGLYEFASALQPAQPSHKIAGLSSVTLRYISTLFGPRLSVMITEATGVYELVQPDPVGDPDTWVVNWMLPSDAYESMRRPRSVALFSLTQLGRNPERLRPKYARRLDSGEVLVVNSYMGRMRDNSEFFGEVVLIDGTIGGVGVFPGYDVLRENLGFNSLSVIYELPPVQGIRGLVRPVYAERQ